MGYSGRYHAASLAAVFIALAIGILIGVGLADEVVSPVSEELEESLRSDLDEAEQSIEDLQTDLDREREFGDSVFPALVSDRLSGSEVALIGLGGLPRETAADVEAAIEPAGATMQAVAVVSLPPDVEALVEQIDRRQFRGARRDTDRLRSLGRSIGRQIPGGGPLIERVGGTLFSRFSGELDSVDLAVMVRDPADDLDEEEQERSDAFEDGLIRGISEGASGAVGVARTSTDPATLAPFERANVPTADHVDLTAGRVATVLALLGAEGSYGVGSEADSFLPDPIVPRQSEEG